MKQCLKTIITRTIRTARTKIRITSSTTATMTSRIRRTATAITVPTTARKTITSNNRRAGKKGCRRVSLFFRQMFRGHTGAQRDRRNLNVDFRGIVKYLVEKSVEYSYTDRVYQGGIQ